MRPFIFTHKTNKNLDFIDFIDFLYTLKIYYDGQEWPTDLWLLAFLDPNQSNLNLLEIGTAKFNTGCVFNQAMFLA